jgi:hypothetical protein
MRINLNRIATSMEQNACFGHLNLGEVTIAETLELPYKLNEHGISSIPVGIYTCKRTNSPKFGDVFEVMGVPNRTDILIHKGNIPSDTHGCILIGGRFGIIEGKHGICDSSLAFNKFMDMLEGVNEFELEITYTEAV